MLYPTSLIQKWNNKWFHVPWNHLVTKDWSGNFVVGDRGVTISCFPYPVLPPPVPFCPFVSQLPPLIVFLPLSCKSRCLTPYFNRECFGLVQNKKLCCKSNHFALSSAVIEAAFLQHKFTPRSKIFSVLWTTVVRSELPGRSSMDGFFPTTLQNTETDQNGLWRHFTWLALLFLRRISTASETDETLTRLTQSISSTHVYMCHAISFMSYDVNDLERFPISQEVMLFFFIPSMNFHCLTFLAYKFCFKPRKTLNGSRETLGSFLWLDVKQWQITKAFLFEFLSCFPPS